MTTITPIGDRVLVRPVEEDTTTASGIIIPDSAQKEKPLQGEVVAVGEGERENGKLIAPPVAKGDVVVFAKYAYDEVEIDNEAYYIIKSENILAVLK